MQNWAVLKADACMVVTNAGLQNLTIRVITSGTAAGKMCKMLTSIPVSTPMRSSVSPLQKCRTMNTPMLYANVIWMPW